MSALGKILFGIETEYKENGNKKSNSNDVVNEVFLRRVNVPAVPLLKTSYLQLESFFKRSDVKSVPKVFEIECRGQRTSADTLCVLPCL